MFFRQKRSGKYTYLQIVENRWEDGRSKQRVIVTLGRLDELREQGQLDGLLRSGAKLSQAAMLLTAQQKGELPVITTKRIGPELIFQRLEEQLQRGDKSLVGNRGYRKYLKGGKTHFEIDQQKIKSEARYDGKWVLRTDLDELSAEDVALRYKQLWMVEDCIRSIKSILATRPIFHHHDETIRGHVFCSFLALVLRKELQDRLTAAGYSPEWADVLRDLESLQSVEVEYQGKHFRLRSEARGTCSQVFQAVGVAFPPTMEHVIN